MKISSILSVIALSLGSLAGAAEVWAYGVSPEGGWYDYAKSNGNTYETDDANMCWAASAANIIAWWQNHNEDTITHLTLPPDPWDAFRIVWQNGGGYINYALDWYINGIKDQNGYALTLPAGYDPNVSYDDKENKLPDYRYGSFLNPFGDPSQSVYSTVDNPIQLVNVVSSGYDVCGTIIDSLSSGYALGLSAFSESSAQTIAHAITLWGVEYDVIGNQRVLTKIWVTDSDDDTDTLQEFEILVKDSSVAISTPGYMNGAEIRRVDGMRTTILVPEPASATLSLLALAALASRRRRQ